VSTEDPSPPRSYAIRPSARVVQDLRALSERATAAGFRQEFLDALKRINRILTIYPQFGEPLRDLQIPGQTLHALVSDPLLVRYILDETNSTVFIVEPFEVLPASGFQ
jgi:hypothetical protein